MQPDEIHNESIPFPLVRVLVMAQVALAAAFLFLFIYQLISGLIGNSPAPNWFYLLMMVIFAAVAALLTNFTKLNISMTAGAITVGYGRFRYTIPWQRIEGCHQDKKSGIAYGDWGIRMAKAGGKSILVYNVIRAPRVILELKEGRFSQFAFSTRHPEDAINVIQQQRM
jgi:hypothetical protein